MELQTIPEVVAQCRNNVTLTCDVSSLQLSDITSVSWVGRNKTLCKSDGRDDPEVLCQNSSKMTHYTLTLTLINVMPVHQGKYICKLRSKLGIKSNSSLVKVEGEFTCSFPFYVFICVASSFLKVLALCRLPWTS